MYEEIQGAREELDHGPGDKFHLSPFPAVSQTMGRRSVLLDECARYQPALENL